MKGYTYEEWKAGGGFGGPVFVTWKPVTIEGITVFNLGMRSENTFETVDEKSVMFSRWIGAVTFTRAGSSVMHGVEFDFTPGDAEHAIEELKAAVSKDDGEADHV